MPSEGTGNSKGRYLGEGHRKDKKEVASDIPIGGHILDDDPYKHKIFKNSMGKPEENDAYPTPSHVECAQA